MGHLGSYSVFLGISHAHGSIHVITFLSAFLLLSILYCGQAEQLLRQEPRRAGGIFCLPYTRNGNYSATERKEPPTRAETWVNLLA